MTETQPPSRSGGPGTHGSPERPARQLEAPLLQLDLEAETASLRAERPYVEGDRNARTLAKSSWFRLTLVALRPDAAFEEADQRGVVAIQVLAGGLGLEVEGSEADDSEADDSAAGDSAAGDSAAGDSAAGDSEAGDSAAAGPQRASLSVGQLAVVGAGHPWHARSVGETVLLIRLSWPPEPGDAS